MSAISYKSYPVRLLILLLALLLIWKAQALESDKAENAKSHYISFMPYFETSIGGESEYVFIPASDNVTLSRLDYKETPILKLCLDVQYEGPYLFMDINVQDGISSLCGSMYDYDWLNRESDITDNTITNYSSHDCSLYRYYTAELKAGAKIPVYKFTLSPYAGCYYRYSYFNLMDGEYSYGTATDGVYSSYDSDSATTGTLTGKVMSLERNIIVSWIGFNAGFEMFDRLGFSADIAVSPFTYISSKDNHYGTTTYYLDVIKGFMSVYKAGLTARFYISPLNSLEIGYNALFSLTMTGTGYAKKSLSSSALYTKLTSSYSGASFYHNNIYAGFRILL